MRVLLTGIEAGLGRRRILSGIDLEIPSGSLTAIVGPNGSGKSTLLRTIYRALRPTKGSVLIGDTNVWRAGPKQAALLRAVVPQHQPTHTELRVSEVVELGRFPHHRWFERTRHRDSLAIQSALDAVGITELADRQVTTLSGGELQRVLLARALVQQAPVLILDEPTNHLDPRAQLDLLRLVADLDHTRILVLHDLDQALSIADHVAVLDQGRLIIHDKPAIALNRHRLHATFGLESMIIPHPLADREHLTWTEASLAPANPDAAGPSRGRIAPWTEQETLPRAKHRSPGTRPSN